MSQPVIHIVDDDNSFRRSTSRLLRACGYDVVEYESARYFLSNPPLPGPGCILLDIRMPHLGGLELQANLTEQGCPLPIVFLSGHGDIPTSVTAVKAGAEDFLPKPVSKDKLLGAITRAFARYEQDHARRSQIEALRSLTATLTAREQQVFAMVVRGKLNKQIAYELGTTERTIKAHRQKVMSKFNTQSLAELVLIGERLGIIKGVIGEPQAAK
jgi:FixJ family two-component response regulator